jgi:hypothetical protein
MRPVLTYQLRDVPAAGLWRPERVGDRHSRLVYVFELDDGMSDVCIEPATRMIRLQDAARRNAGGKVPGSFLVRGNVTVGGCPVRRGSLLNRACPGEPVGSNPPDIDHLAEIVRAKRLRDPLQRSRPRKVGRNLRSAQGATDAGMQGGKC